MPAGIARLGAYRRMVSARLVGEVVLDQGRVQVFVRSKTVVVIGVIVVRILVHMQRRCHRR